MKHLKPRSLFVFENMDKAKSIFNKKVQDFEKLKTLLQKKLGYIGKFTEYLLNDNVPYNELENLYGELVNLQKRQSPIDINPLSYEQALDKIQSTKENIKIKEFLNLLPSEQKEYAKNILGWNKKLVLDVANSPNLDKIVSKISRYKSADELESAFLIISKPKDNSKEGVKREISGLKNSKISYGGENLLIVIVNSHDDMKSLGSDTSWCIVASEYQYEKYTRGRIQYVIYDYSKDEFDEKFKIGLTLEKDGDIYACHDILDNKVTESYILELLSGNGLKIEDILPKFEPVNIDISKINRNTNFTNIEEMLGSATKEQTLEVLKKVCLLGDLRTPSGRTGDRERSRISLISKCYKKLFGQRDWVLRSELDKISKEVGDTIVNRRGWLDMRNRSINLITNEVDFDLSEKAFEKGLEIWKDSELKKICTYNIDEVVDNFKKEIQERLLVRMKKIMDSGYENPEFILSTILLSKSLGKLDDIPNWKELVKKYRNDSDSPLSIDREFDLEFSLDEISFTDRSKLKEGDVKNIEKKDYSGLLITPYNLSFYDSLVDHLKDNKLGLRIRKGDIPLMMKRYKDSNSVIANLIKELGKSKRKVSGKSLTSGNVSLEIL